MASRKGIVATVAILATITGASFLLWIVPQDSKTTFVVSDYKSYLDGVKNIQEILHESIDIEYKNMISGEISPEDYIKVADVTSSQVIAQISEFITSKPPEEWQDSYTSYMKAMKKFNTYIKETKVLAKMIQVDDIEEKKSQIMQKIESLKAESLEHVRASDESRPD